MNHELRKCATILTNLRKAHNEEYEEALFAQEQRARKIAAAERITKHAQEIGVKLFDA